MSGEVSVAARCLGKSLWLLDVKGSVGVAVRYYLLRIVAEPNKDKKGVSFIFFKVRFSFTRNINKAGMTRYRLMVH